jgi:hypothetical protein
MLVGQSTEEDRDAGVTNYFAGASGLASASAKPMGVLSGLDTIESDDLEARGITLARGDCRHHAYDHQTKHLFAVLREGTDGLRLHLAPGLVAHATYQVDRLVAEAAMCEFHDWTSFCQPSPLPDNLSR